MDTETRYSQIERKALTVVFSCEQFKSYIYGLQFTVAIDHKLLLKLKSPSCSELPTRIHRWSLRLQEFDFKLEHEPGINNITDIL